MHPLILRPRALFYRTDCTRRSKFLTHALNSNDEYWILVKMDSGPHKWLYHYAGNFLLQYVERLGDFVKCGTYMQDLEKRGILFATNSLTNFSYIQLAISKAGCIAVNFCLDQTTICPAVSTRNFSFLKK